MTRPVILDPLAVAEAIEAASWYDNRCPGLGKAFLAKLELTVAQIHRFPESFEEVPPVFRRAVLGRFPYFIGYRITPEAIRILAVMHERRAPNGLTSRLEAADG